MADDLVSSRKVYEGIIKKKVWWLLLGFFLLLMLFLLDVVIGPAWLSFKEIAEALFYPDSVDPKNKIIVNVIRLPVAAMAVAVGATLGTAGAQMQTVLNNPLASPYTLGISAAASFGAAVAIVFCRGLHLMDEILLIPLSAFAFAMLSSVILYFLSRTKKVSIYMIILTGVALSFLFNSLLSLLQYIAKEDQFEAIVLWMFGSLQNASWVKVSVVAIALTICLPIFLSKSWQLMALQLGDEKARSMGVRTDRLRFQVILLTSFLTAVSVCFVGTIGFIGLVAPHIARTLAGEDQRFFLPLSALLGAIMLSFASIVSKSVIEGAIFPVGITTSLIGIPFLLAIILRRRKRL